jgi:hypothetical protein
VAVVAVLLSAFRAGAQTNFATLVSDGAWTWFNDPRALFHNGKLYFGYVRAADSKTVLSTFDPATGQTTNLWTSGFTQFDDHNNPGLLAKQDGTLLAIYSRHGSDQYYSYRTSSVTNPVAGGDWNAELSIPNSGAGMTYANPFQLSAESGKIYNFCRNTNFNPTVYTSTDGGTNWSAPQHFILTGTGSIRPYVKYASDYSNRMDFLYTDGHPRDVTNSLYHLYYSGGGFYQTDGTFVTNYSGLPLLHDSGQRGSVIYQYSDADTSDANDHIPTGRAWCWETAYQSNGAPVCVFTVQRDNIATNGSILDRIYYYYARWTGTNWQKRFIAHAGRPLYAAEDDYAGGICIDPVEPNIIYISSNAQDPFNLADTTNVTLRASERYELWRGVTADGGLTFSWTQITSNSTADNLRPYIPRRNGGERCVIWFRGSYAAYTSYAAAIVGLFTTQVPVAPTPQPLSINYVDATSGAGGNTTLANGSVFSPPLNGTTGADNNWEQRTVFGSSGNIFESGGETSENAPELRTTLSGLTPGAPYAIYVMFWDANGGTENWNIRAEFASAPGANTLYSASDAAAGLGATPSVLASTLTYATAPTLFVEGNRALMAAAIGTNTADISGNIRVYLDDKPTTIGANNRTWYDGLGWALITASYPTNLSFSLTGNMLAVSWPASHLGWILQAQTNSLTVGISSNWFDMPSSSSQTQAVVNLDRNNGVTGFRLRHP